MSGYVNDYRDLLKIASDSFNELLENTFVKPTVAKHLSILLVNKTLSLGI